MTAKWNCPDPDNLVKDYLAGTSEKALAKTFGVSRQAIRRVLTEHDVEPRGRSAAMFTRMAATPPEERARLASAAHAAARGRTHSLEERIKRARRNEEMGLHISETERAFAGMLRAQGLEVSHQTAVGPYNADLTTGTVAVEVLGGHWHGRKRHGERLRYLLDHGWDVIYVWVNGTSSPLSAATAEYIAAHAQFRSSNPSAPRCYRVVRGASELVAQGSADDQDLPDKLPFTDRPSSHPTEVATGLCQCGCGQTTNVSHKTRRGYRTGEHVRYISGHNSLAGRRNTRRTDDTVGM